MRLIAIEVEHFRGYRDVTRIGFEPHSVVVGGSASGKTSLLDAIDLVLTSRRGSAVSELDFSDQDLGTVEAPRTLRIEVTIGGFKGVVGDQVGRFADRLEVADPDGKIRVDAEPEQLTAERAVVRMALLATRDPETGEIAERIVYPGFKSPGTDELVRVTDAERRAVGFLYLASPRRGPEALSWAWNSPLGRLLNAHGVRASDALRDLGRHLEQLGPEILASVTGLENARAALQSLLSTASPESGRLGFTVAPGTSRDLLRSVQPTLPSASGARELPIDAWSQAERSIATIAVELALAKELSSAIVALDEPELHLGPARQRHLVATLLQQAGQVIVATQSPEIARAFMVGELVATRRTSAGSFAHPVPVYPTDLRHMPSRMAAIAAALSARAAVVCEGIPDQMALEGISAVAGGFLRGRPRNRRCLQNGEPTRGLWRASRIFWRWSCAIETGEPGSTL
jgi:energy-coupling factor transporter ATP-binding protein EcfA2